jgi:hypothetical protein
MPGSCLVLQPVSHSWSASRGSTCGRLDIRRAFAGSRTGTQLAQGSAHANQPTNGLLALRLLALRLLALRLLALRLLALRLLALRLLALRLLAPRLLAPRLLAPRLLAPRSPLPAPRSPLPAPRSPLPAPRSPLPAPRSPLPAPRRWSQRRSRSHKSRFRRSAQLHRFLDQRQRRWQPPPIPGASRLASLLGGTDTAPQNRRSARPVDNFPWRVRARGTFVAGQGALPYEDVRIVNSR